MTQLKQTQHIQEEKSRTVLFFFILFGFIILGSLLLVDIEEIPQEEQKLYIGVVGPLTGQYVEQGRAMLQGIHLYQDEINAQGGVRGKKVEVNIFNDQNDIHLAQEKARRIVQEDQVLLVIGHYTQSATLAASEIYQQFHIPLLWPSSREEKIVSSNLWYFPVTPTYMTEISTEEKSLFQQRYQKKYDGELPNPTTMAYYQLMRLAVNVVQETEIQGALEYRKQERQAIQTQLAQLLDISNQ